MSTYIYIEFEGKSLTYFNKL